MFKNDDVNPDKSIKKKRFLDPDNISEMVECVGDVADWELEFEQLDVQKRGKVHYPKCPECISSDVEVSSCSYQKTV